MKIVCQSVEFEKDMQDLVNLFYEDDCPFSIQHSSSRNANQLQSFLKVEIDGQEKQYFKAYTLPAQMTVLQEKSLLKRHYKNHLYEVLSTISGKKLPWGSLTGV